MSAAVSVETVPATCLVKDVCRLLKISRSQFFNKRAELQQLGILVEQTPKLDRNLRFQGAPLARFLGEDEQATRQAREVRQAIRAVAGGKR